MKTHEFLPHTADVIVRATGGSFEEALEAAADGLFETVAGKAPVPGGTEIEVEERAGDLGSLAVFTLSRLLSEMDAGDLFFGSFAVKEFARDGETYRIRGVASGSGSSPGRGGTIVKAVTHGLTEVKNEGGRWTITILLDI